MTDYKYNRLVNDRIVSCTKRRNMVHLGEVEIIDTVIVTDCYGNNQVKVTDNLKTEEFDNIFKATLLKIQQEKGSQQETIDEYLNTKRKSLYDKLETARISFSLQQYTKAIDLYESALKTIENDSYPDEFRLRDNDILAVKYALALCNLGLNTHGSLQTAANTVMAVLKDCGLQFPKLYYLLAKIKFNLFFFDQAIQMLNIGLNVLKGSFKLLELHWPTSHLILIDGDKLKLEKNMNVLMTKCVNAPMPNIKCVYSKCDAASNGIFFESPDFVGYIKVICTENCHTIYHQKCWKTKLKLNKDKNNKKDILNIQCETSDCSGCTTEIKVYDEKLNLKSTIKGLLTFSDKKDTANLFSEEPKNEKPEVKKKFVIKTSLSSLANKNLTDSETKKAVPTNLKVDNLKKIATLKQCAVIKSPTLPGKQEYHFENSSSSLIINNSKLKADVPEFLPKHSPRNDVSPRPIILPVISQYEHNVESQYPPQSWQPYIPVERNPTLHDLGMQKRQRTSLITITPETKHKGFQTDTIEKKSIETQIYADVKNVSTQINDNKEINCLSSHINTLSHELFEREEAYNAVLYKFKALQILYNNSVSKQNHNTSTQNHGGGDLIHNEQIKTLHTSTQVDSIAAKNDESNGNKHDGFCNNTDYLVDKVAVTRLVELKKENQVLFNNINELKSTLRLERSNFSDCIDKYKLQLAHSEENNKDLKNRNAKLSAEYENYKNNNNASYYQSMLLQQIDYNKQMYQVYLENMEGKCRYMLWQLDEVKLLTTDASCPSSNEIEENYQLWQKTFDETKFCKQVSQNYFANIYKKFESQPYDQSAISSLPVLVVEPQNLLIHHFKTNLLVNKKLEQDLSKNMLIFYNLLSTSNHCQNNVMIHEPTTQDVVLRNSVAIPPGFSNNHFNPTATTSTAGLEEEAFVATAIPGTSDKNYIPPAPVASTSKPRLVNVNNISEDIPKTGSIPKKHASEGKTKKKGLETASDSQFPTSELPKAEQKLVQDVVGIDALLLSLQKYFPLCGVRTIADALHTLRERQGGLTGMTNKEIATAIKKIIKENVPRDKTDDKKCATKTTPQAWAKINNGVEWQNSNPDQNCTICFEVMDRKHSVQLTCQHIFHTNCIKKWLQTNSICPICRSFTKLNDEFPPLM